MDRKKPLYPTMWGIVAQMYLVIPLYKISAVKYSERNFA
jgi:hypothetical protein